MTSPAQAAAPLSGQQAAGWYRYKVGDIEVTVATDGVNRFSPRRLYYQSRPPRDQCGVGGLLSAARSRHDRDPVLSLRGEYRLGLVVIDTGTGEANFKNSKGAAGQFHNNLKASGIDRNQVDVVVISHIHGDHINGLLTPDSKPAFPNAEIMVPAPEWKYFTDDGEMSRQTTDRMKGVFAGFRRVFDALAARSLSMKAARKSCRASLRSRPMGTRPATCRTSCRRARARSTSRPT